MQNKKARKADTVTFGPREQENGLSEKMVTCERIHTE
jgi:hypothetical protein